MFKEGIWPIVCCIERGHIRKFWKIFHIKLGNLINTLEGRNYHPHFVTEVKLVMTIKISCYWSVFITPKLMLSTL